jgi:hypothetical protein
MIVGVLGTSERRVRLKNLRPGLFLWKDTLCLMTEYGTDAYIVSTGEAFWGGVQTPAQRDDLLVTPVKIAPHT